MVKTFLCYLFLGTCVLIILLQGLHPTWNGHLITDLYIFKERASGNLTNNEYQPGALLFFNLLTPFAINQELDTFKTAFFSINILLIFLTAFFIQKVSKSENNIILGIIILFTGPILLFRFELLVIFLVISSIYYFKRGSTDISSILLALATSVKVYPIIYLPYLAINLYKQKRTKEFIRFLGLFIATSGIFIVGFMYLYNFSLTQILNSIRYHVSKPIGVEGFWSSVISIIHVLLTGTLPSLVGEYMTWGISAKDQILSMWFFDNFWILILGILYFIYLKNVDKKFNQIFLLTITLATIIFSKLSSPQFLIWFLFLLPLVDFKKFIHNTRYSLILIASLAATFLTQYIYPLNYSEFLSSFSKGSPNYLFYIFILKNLLLLTVFNLLLTLNND